MPCLARALPLLAILPALRAVPAQTPQQAQQAYLEVASRTLALSLARDATCPAEYHDYELAALEAGRAAAESTAVQQVRAVLRAGNPIEARPELRADPRAYERGLEQMTRRTLAAWDSASRAQGPRLTAADCAGGAQRPLLDRLLERARLDTYDGLRTLAGAADAPCRFPKDGEATLAADVAAELAAIEQALPAQTRALRERFPTPAGVTCATLEKHALWAPQRRAVTLFAWHMANRRAGGEIRGPNSLASWAFDRVVGRRLAPGAPPLPDSAVVLAVRPALLTQRSRPLTDGAADTLAGDYQLSLRADGQLSLDVRTDRPLASAELLAGDSAAAPAARSGRGAVRGGTGGPSRSTRFLFPAGDAQRVRAALAARGTPLVVAVVDAGGRRLRGGRTDLDAEAAARLWAWVTATGRAGSPAVR